MDLLVINMTFVVRRNAQTARRECVSFIVYFDSFSSLEANLFFVFLS